MRNGRLKTRAERAEAAALAALCFALCWSVQLTARQRALEDKIIRLHVIAVDDTAEEQAVKNEVAGAVREYLTALTSAAETKREAEALISESLDAVAAAAAEKSGGREITVELGEASYGTRSWNGLTLPAGEYTSLRVTLGDGEGHNWWGVIFPQLNPAADPQQALEALGGGFIIEENGGGAEVRLRVLEWINELRGMLAE